MELTITMDNDTREVLSGLICEKINGLSQKIKKETDPKTKSVLEHKRAGLDNVLGQLV